MNSRRRRQRPSLAGGGSALLIAAVAATPMILLLSSLLGSSLPWSSFLTTTTHSLVLRVDAAADAALKCAGGWDSSSSSSSVEKMVEIPKSWINDGYCDCPYDGLDEPQTQACSGSSSWPGISAIDDDEKKESPVFSCPQQPNLKLPLSRLNDGICDCCDGADEIDDSLIHCEDICEEVLREEREARARLETNFLTGSKKRQEELEAFKTLRETKVKELDENGSKITTFESDIAAVQGQIRDLKQNYAKSRMATMRDEVSVAGFDGFLSALDRKELESFIIHSCQVAGELLSNTQHDNTCVALRMAGLDLALTWSDDDYDNVDNMTGSIDATMEWVNLLFDNASNGPQRLKWRIDNNKGSNNRRRLDEVFDDDEMGGADLHNDPDIEDEYPDYDDYDGMDYDGYYGTDDYVPPDDHLNDDIGNGVDESNVDEESGEGKQKEVIDEIKATKFSSPRISFLDRARLVVDEITKILDAPSPQQEEVTETDGEDKEAVGDDGEAQVESADEDESSENDFDPAAYTMVRTELKKIESSINKGFKWAASAKLLFSFSGQSDENLKRLAVGTLYYGQVSSLQVWQILQSTLPEYSTTEGTTTEDTCASPWASACPPKVLSRATADGQFPPEYILNAGTKFCEEQVLTLNSAMAEACSASTTSGDGDIPVDIPASIPDGYYGYSKPTSRTEDDELSKLFAPIDSLPVDKDGLQELENKKRDLEQEKRDVQTEIDNGWKDVGGKDGTEMGPDGELHALANRCISVDAGKYTYETCIFGKSTQRDIGQTAGGTSLGTWKGMSIDEASGRREMKWDGGMKCWNGPQRSATVYVSCGAETKLISADEPDTCRYVFEMESHIACDEPYRVANDL